MNPIRVGQISFTNILPLYYYLKQNPALRNLQFMPRVPTQLNREMAQGMIDMGPISSFAYAQAYPRYVLLPDLSVSASGAVGSIFLFTKGLAWSDLRHARIALTCTSASSVVLLKILLERFAGATPEYITLPPSLDVMMKQADAALLIGDDALTALWNNPGYLVFDLGEEWFKRTGLSMTFAVWAVQRELVEARATELVELYHLFIQAKEKGVRQIAPVIQAAMRQLGGTESFWRTYYRGLCYDLRERELIGLHTFYRYAAELGLLSPDVQMCMLDGCPIRQSMQIQGEAYEFTGNL
jgi:chorismate dehydratase